MKYQIGRVASLLGVSAEGLRLYERIGILSPQRESASGYRYYDRLDITSLLRARSYQKYGFSLQEVKDLLNTDDMQFVCDSYERQEKRLEEEILLRRLELRRMRQTREMLEAFPASLRQIHREMRPALYRLEFMVDLELCLAQEDFPLLQKWMAYAPLAFSSLRNDWEAMKSGQDVCYSGIALRAEDAMALGAQEIVEQGVFMPSCPCLATVVSVEGETVNCADYLAHLAAYVKENGIVVTGDPVSESLVSMNKQRNYTRYRKVWLPIEENT